MTERSIYICLFFSGRPLNSTCTVYIQTVLETRERGSKQICQEAGLDSGRVWPPVGILKHSLFHSVSRSVVRRAGNCLPLFGDIFSDPETSLPRCPDSHVMPQYWGTSSQFVLTKLTMKRGPALLRLEDPGTMSLLQSGTMSPQPQWHQSRPQARWCRSWFLTCSVGGSHPWWSEPVDSEESKWTAEPKERVMVQCCHNTVHSDWMSLDVVEDNWKGWVVD